MTDDATYAAVERLLGLGAALFGALVGSFLNVVVARVPQGESVVHPRSRCPRCRRLIAWYDNVPIVSWLILRGRCRGCALPISLRYPLVELLGAALGWAALHRHGPVAPALAEFTFTAFLLALAAIDLDTWLLPNALTWPLLAFGLLCGLAGWSAAPGPGAAAWGAGLGFGAFWLVAVLGEKAFGKEALGFGDVWLLGGLGAWLGASALLPVVLLASTQGALVGVALILVGKAQPGPAAPAVDQTPGAPVETVEPARAPADGDAAGSAHGAPAPDEQEADWVPPKNAVPFGPFLVAGALEWLWFSEALMQAAPVLRVFR